MTPHALAKLQKTLGAFLSEMTDGQGRPERRAALGSYVTGLLLDGERKSVQPMAARLVSDPGQVDAMRQRLQDCISASEWSELELKRRLAKKVLRELPKTEVLVIDDTGFPKKGTHSVGVARQYSGTFGGGTANGQVATSVHLAGGLGSVMISMRLYLPKEWTDDVQRCRKAGIPADVGFKPKWEIALGLIDEAIGFGVTPMPILADAGYGALPRFRDELTRRGLPYVVGISNNHLVLPPGTSLKPPKPPSGRPGRIATRWHAGETKPIQLRKLVAGLTRAQYKTVSWGEGSQGRRSSKFLPFRVRPAEKHTQGRPIGDELWLLCEWQKCETTPRFHFSTLPPSTSLRELVRITKLRWRVERDYQELKSEIGLDHFEGRTWRGFHRHATLCAVAHAFLALQRALFSPARDHVDGSPSA